MENNKQNTLHKKYPKSIDGSQCIGPCYKSREIILHPVTLEWITDKHNSFCPINENDDGEVTKECAKITSNDVKSSKDFDFEMLLPFVDLTPQRFLKLYYNIYSIDDAFLWLNEHEYLALDTRIRVINNTISAYGKQSANYKDVLTDFILEIAQKKWNEHIYENISKYIYVDEKENKIIFVDPKKNKLNKNDFYGERTKFIFDKLFSQKNVSSFLDKLIHKQDLDINSMKYKLTEYMTEKIKLSIDN